MSTETIEGAVQEDVVASDTATTEQVTIPKGGKVTASTVDGTITKVEKVPGKKGRPSIHPFAGRHTFLRDEVVAALANPQTLVDLMNEAHAIDADRIDILAEDGMLDNTLNFTFQGPIDMVLAEMLRVGAQYPNAEFNLHKVRTYTNASKPNYVAPVTEVRNGKDVTLQIEALPDRIYGYVTVTL